MNRTRTRTRRGIGDSSVGYVHITFFFLVSWQHNLTAAVLKIELYELCELKKHIVGAQVAQVGKDIEFRQQSNEINLCVNKLNFVVISKV